MKAAPPNAKQLRQMKHINSINAPQFRPHPPIIWPNDYTYILRTGLGWHPDRLLADQTYVTRFATADSIQHNRRRANAAAHPEHQFFPAVHDAAWLNHGITNDTTNVLGFVVDEPNGIRWNRQRPA